MGIFDKAKDALSQHPDQVAKGIDKLGDLVDKRTGGQHAEQVDRAQELVRERLNAPGEQPGTTSTPTTPPA